jgi:WD40 repeat-containing protein SMU1
MCGEAVLALACSPDSEFLATGCRDGSLAVWSLTTGKKSMEFPRAHAEGITSVAFSKEGAQLLTGSFDTLARCVWGARRPGQEPGRGGGGRGGGRG